MNQHDIAKIRILVCFSTILYLVFFFLPYIYQYTLSEEVNYYISSSPVKPFYDITMAQYWVILMVHMASFFALYARVIFARYLFLLIVVMDFIIALMSGVTSYTGLDVVIFSLLNMTSGLILYFEFFVLRNSR